MTYYPGATEAIRLGNAQNAGYDDGYRRAVEDAAAVCTAMLNNSDWGLDRERTVGELRHRINKLAARLGQEVNDAR